tara:strand:- start:678 stop:1736 length:1059 start_codon:yes stop_codon:yes gene_type:complete
MKSSIKKCKNCKRVIEIKLSPERVKEEFEKVYKSIGKVANVPGYRVGKVPRDLLEQNFAKTAHEEVLKSLVPETYGKAIEEYKLDPIGHPGIQDLKLDLKAGFSYTANIEIRPEFTLKNYKGLKLKKKKVDIKEDDVKKSLESLKESHAQSVPKKEGDKKETTLAKIDDNFAKDLGLENLEKLKDAVRKNLEYKAESEAQSDLEMQVVNQLVNSMNFEIPESLVDSEKKRLMKDAESRIAYMEAIQKKSDPNKKFTLSDKDKLELEANAEKQAIRQVKVFFILDKIAQAEKIYITKEELQKRVEEIAAQYKRPANEIRKQLEDNHMIDEIAMNIRNAKVLESLLKQAKLSNE